MSAHRRYVREPGGKGWASGEPRDRPRNQASDILELARQPLAQRLMILWLTDPQAQAQSESQLAARLGVAKSSLQYSLAGITQFDLAHLDDGHPRRVIVHTNTPDAVAAAFHAVVSQIPRVLDADLRVRDDFDQEFLADQIAGLLANPNGYMLIAALVSLHGARKSRTQAALTEMLSHEYARHDAPVKADGTAGRGHATQPDRQVRYFVGQMLALGLVIVGPDGAVSLHPDVALA